MKDKLEVLIVEDDRVGNEYLSVLMSRLSNKIHLAKNGEEALDQLKLHPDVDLILMDIKMPRMDGYEATKEIRTFNKDVIIIAQTAYALLGDREKAIEAGCNDYIAKPISKDELLRKIAKYFNINTDN